MFFLDTIILLASSYKYNGIFFFCNLSFCRKNRTCVARIRHNIKNRRSPAKYIFICLLVKYIFSQRTSLLFTKFLQ